MSDHFLVRAGQTLVVISCSLKFERMGFPGIRGSHKAELSIGPKGFTQQKGFAPKEVWFSLVKKWKNFENGGISKNRLLAQIFHNSGGKIMLPNLPATKFGAHLYPWRTITWLESSVPVLISKDRTRTEYDFGSSFGTRIGMGTKTNPIFGTGTGSKIRLIGFRS